MPVMTPAELVSVVKEVKPLVYGAEVELAAGAPVGAWGWPSLICEMALTVASWARVVLLPKRARRRRVVCMVMVGWWCWIGKELVVDAWERLIL